MSVKNLTEGTSNFWSMDKFPLLVFKYYEDEYDYVEQDAVRGIVDEHGPDYDYSDEELEMAMEKAWEEHDDSVCLLDEDEINSLKDDISEFNYNLETARYEHEEESEDFVEDCRVELKSGYYEGAQLYVPDEDYLADWQVEKVNEFLKRMKEKYGLTQLGVSYRFDNGETGYHKVDESFKSVPNWFKSLCSEANAKCNGDIYCMRDFIADKSNLAHDNIREWYAEIYGKLGLPPTWDYDEWDREEIVNEPFTDFDENLNNSELNEQAMIKADAMERCFSLAEKFIEHFDKIYNDIDSEAINHWASEMQAWLNQVLDIKLKSTNKSLSLQQKMDWFFTKGSDSETLFSDNATEAEVYDDFVSKVVETSDVKKSLKELDLLESFSQRKAMFANEFDEDYDYRPKKNPNTTDKFRIEFDDLNDIYQIKNLTKNKYLKKTFKKEKAAELFLDTADMELLDFDESLSEDIVKTSSGKWVNKGKEGTHGTFRTKKAADAQRKAMFANGYTEDITVNVIGSDNDDNDGNKVKIKGKHPHGHGFMGMKQFEDKPCKSSRVQSDAASIKESFEEQYLADQVTEYLYDKYPQFGLINDVEGTYKGVDAVALTYDKLSAEAIKEVLNKFGDRIVPSSSRYKYAPEISHATLFVLSYPIEESLKESKRGFVTKYRGYSIHDAGDVYVITDEHGKNIKETKSGIPVIKAMVDEIIDGGDSIKEDIIDITADDFQRSVNNAIRKFGRVGGKLYDELDDAGFYLTRDNKVMPKSGSANIKESVDFDDKKEYRVKDYSNRWGIIDAMKGDDGKTYALLENNEWGDETCYLVVELGTEVDKTYTNKSTGEKAVLPTFMSVVAETYDALETVLKQDLDLLECNIKESLSTDDIKSNLHKEVLKILTTNPEFGFENEKEAEDLSGLVVEVLPDDDGYTKLEVRAEFDYEGMDRLADELQKFLNTIDKDAYFEQEDTGIMNAFVKLNPDKNEGILTTDECDNFFEESLTEGFSDDEIRIYMNTWANYNENGADLSQYGINSISDGWLTVDDAIEFAENHAEDEPFINDTDNCPIKVSEYDTAISTLNFLKEFESGNYDMDLISAITEAVNVDLKGAMEIYDNDSYEWYPGVTNYKDLAEVIISEVGGPAEALGDRWTNYIDENEIRRDYDFDAEEYLRRDARKEIASDEGIDEDEVTEDQIEEYIEDNKDAIIDEWVRLDLESAERGEVDLSDYFDYEAFGRDLKFDGYFTTDTGTIRID